MIIEKPIVRINRFAISFFFMFTFLSNLMYQPNLYRKAEAMIELHQQQRISAKIQR